MVKGYCQDISLTEFKFNIFSWSLGWASSFSVVALLIIIGNSLTMATLLKKKFRRRPHFLQKSLAFVDLFVGLMSILLLLTFSYHSSALIFAYYLLDMFTSLSSVFHLAVISLERLHAPLRPFRHRQLSSKAYRGCHSYTMDPFLFRGNFNPVWPGNATNHALYDYNLLNNSIAHNMFLLSRNLHGERGEKVAWEAFDRTKKQDSLGPFS